MMRSGFFNAARTGLGLLAAAPRRVLQVGGVGLGGALLLPLAVPVLSAEEKAAQSILRTIKQTSSTAVKETLNIINWQHIRELVRYDSWPVVPRWLKIAFLVAGGTYLTYRALKAVFNMKRFSAVKRTVEFYKVAGPFLFRYKMLERKINKGTYSAEEQQKMFNEIHEVYAPKFRNMCMELGGAYPKIAQVLASRKDILNPIWVNELKVFLDAVTPRPVAEMLEVLEKSMGKPVREVFEWFDAMPIASASLSQVHLARTRDGHDVAVKIQYPGIREIMMNDMRTSHNFSKRFNPEMSEAADEAERQFEMEFDFTMEADNIRAIHANMQALEDKCMVPYPLFASREVLMMTLVPGVPILKDTRSHEEQAQTYHNILVAMGKQILVDGVFNGDPHPGNFFALPDGRAGLLDFGQVKTLPDDLRLKFAKLMLALAENANDEEITECVLALGFRWKNNIPQYVAGFTRFNFNSARWESLGDGKNPMQVIGEAMKNDPLVRLPGDMTFLFRATTLLRGICYQFPGLVIADVWKPYAQQALAAGPKVSTIQEVGSSA